MTIDLLVRNVGMRFRITTAVNVIRFEPHLRRSMRLLLGRRLRCWWLPRSRPYRYTGITSTSNSDNLFFYLSARLRFIIVSRCRKNFDQATLTISSPIRWWNTFQECVWSRCVDEAMMCREPRWFQLRFVFGWIFVGTNLLLLKPSAEFNNENMSRSGQDDN